MTTTQHGVRVALLMVLAAGLLGWLAAHTAIFFDDGLRYIDQARRLEAGSLKDGLLGAVDHPAYPVAIALAHKALGGDSPEAWQKAAQAASVLIGLLLVIPLYLVSAELFGGKGAWLGVALTYAVPLTGHVLADVLSEGTFLLFWCWGLYTALRFLRDGRFLWLPPTIVFSALAYLSRPEGLLLPAALVACLALMPLLRSTRLNWPRWWAAVGFLVVGPALLVGPYVAAKGGLGTKPAIQRLLGTAPKSAADAVERSRPLEPDQTEVKTLALAVKAVVEAVRDSVTLPVLPLALIGLAVTVWPPRERARVWLFLGIIVGAALLALMRLYATGGYCSPRHAMVIAFLLIPAAGAGLERVLSSLPIPGRWLGLGEERFSAGPAVWVLVLGAFLSWTATASLEPINLAKAGYRDAGTWLIAHDVPAGSRIVDVTGLSLYYAGRPGYTYATLIEAPGDKDLRWIVAKEAHLKGPWTYCQRLRDLVAGLQPVASFPSDPKPGQSRVLIFEKPARMAAGSSSGGEKK